MKKNTLKRVLVGVLSLFFVMNVMALGDITSLSGSGTEADPFLIGTPADLKTIGDGGSADNFKGAHYKFISDIDMTGVTGQKVLWHTGWFEGHIDGGGFVIKNGTFSTQSWLKTQDVKHGAGVFWNFEGTMKNLGFENITIFTAAATVSADRGAAGIIASTLRKGSVVENCYASNCTLDRGSDNPVGGLFGIVEDTVTVMNCYADVNVSSNGVVGGLAGKNSGTLSKVASFGTVSSTVADSSFTVAQNLTLGTVTDSYYKDANGATHITVGATAVGEADLAKELSYPAFDFVARPGWEMGVAYPVIKLTNLITSNVAYVNVGTKNNAKNEATYTNDGGFYIYAPMDSADYVFEAWYRDAEMNDRVQDTLAILSDPTAVGDVTFYAKWVPLQVYDITYENLGDAAANNVATFQNDTAVTLRPVVDYKGGDSSFVAWFKDAAFTQAISRPAIIVGAESNQTFYAKWVYRPFKSGGNGTVEDPYQVSTVYDLQMLTFVPGWSHFIMLNDIDMAGEDYTPINNFSGDFDGSGYVISNLLIEGQGFVKELSGRIKNLGLVGINVNSTAGGTGSFAGIMWNGTSEKAKGLENCYALGDTVKTTGIGVGGLIGYCWTLDNMMTNCYADIHVKGANEVGGLFGRTSLKNAAALSNCAFYGTIETPGAASGAIMGVRHGSSIAGQTLANSLYFLDDIVSKTDQEGAVGIAWDDMSDAANYPALDFVNTWEIKVIDEDTEKECAVLKTMEASAISQVSEVSLEVYPNPSEGVFTFSLEENAQLLVNELSGKLLLQRSASAGLNTIDLSSKGAGLYILSVKTSNSVSVNRLIVK